MMNLIEQLAYRPWVPQSGMKGMFWHLTYEWGNPNHQGHRWPENVLAAVCERGERVPITFDPNCNVQSVYWFQPMK